MYYSLDEAKKLILKAGRDLLEKKLVARTWGNISARISSDSFVITPSGRSYDELSEADLVVVNIHDCSYEGNIKPSSEKLLHAKCYELRDNISFIIHTHQFYASAISYASFDFAACAKYALPGTKALASNVIDKVKNSDINSILLERHGAILLGESYEDSFLKAQELEEKSKAEFLKCLGIKEPQNEREYFDILKNSYKYIYAYLDDFAQLHGLKKSICDKKIEDICIGEDAWAKEQVLLKNCAAMLYARRIGISSLNSFDAFLQRAVYKLKYSKLKDSNK